MLLQTHIQHIPNQENGASPLFRAVLEIGGIARRVSLFLLFIMAHVLEALRRVAENSRGQRILSGLYQPKIPILQWNSLCGQQTTAVGVAQHPVRERAKETWFTIAPRLYSLHKPTVHVYGGLPVNERGVPIEEDVVFAIDVLPVERGRLLLSACWTVRNARRPMRRAKQAKQQALAHAGRPVSTGTRKRRVRAPPPPNSSSPRRTCDGGLLQPAT